MSDAELEAGMYNGPQNRELIRSSTFDKVLTEAKKKRAWIYFKNISNEFLEENA